MAILSGLVAIYSFFVAHLHVWWKFLQGYRRFRAFYQRFPQAYRRFQAVYQRFPQGYRRFQAVYQRFPGLTLDSEH